MTDTDALVSEIQRLADDFNKDGTMQSYDKWGIFLREQWPQLRDAIARLTRERDEADRRAGAAERSLEWERDTNQKARQWRDKQKVEAGYDPNVSFDVVWAETLAKAQQADAARAELATAVSGLEMIAGKRACPDNLMGNVDIAEATLRALKEAPHE